MKDHCTIALVDDHPILLKGLKTMLETTAWIKISGTYPDVDTCLNDFKTNGPPDFLLLDIHLAEKSGEDLAVAVRKGYPDVKIIVFSNLESPYYLQSLLDKGVAGYVIKSSSEETLLAAIETVAEGGIFFDPLIRDKALKLQQGRHVMEGSPALTPREKDILRLLACNKSSIDIGAELFISRRTVEFHRANLLVKLGVKNSASLIKKAVELGIIS